MLTVHNTEAIRRIEAAIGYTFRDKRLLVQVLTRKTYLKIDPEAPDNEVLEFYGDTLMNYHVTNYFMSKYAHMLEDGLFFMRTVEQFTDLRSHYVCNRYLTERVKALGLARYLRAQNRDAELRRDGEKAYADVFESLVGAIYLDSYQNDTLIRAFILRQLGIDPKRAPADIESFDYDTLQGGEGILLDEPDVDLLPADTDTEEVPATSETVEVESSLEEVPAEEKTAVVSLPSPLLETAPEPATEENAVPAEEVPSAPSTNREKLALLCEQLGFEQPTYGETPPNAPNARPVAACTLKYRDARGKQVKISLNDSGRTLAEATEKAAAKMLAKVERQAASASTAEPAAVTEEAPVSESLAPETPAVAPAESAPITDTPADALPEEETPISESAAEISAEPVVESAPAKTRSSTKKKKAAPADRPAEVQSVEPVAEEVKAEEIKPAKKAPAKKKTAAKKKPDTTSEVVAEPVAEEVKAEEIKPAEVKKPRTRKPRTKKETALAEE